MDRDRQIEISKRLSYVLRHAPQSVGIALDEAGWVKIDCLLAALSRHGFEVSATELLEIVGSSDKQRFAVSEDGRRIRANQGHSIPVDLGYQPAIPPQTLYHGTVARFLANIRAEGLKKGSRSHVHLSPDEATATIVGRRRGKPVVLRIRALEMHNGGYAFFLTPNHVWLTDHVPPQFIENADEN